MAGRRPSTSEDHPAGRVVQSKARPQRRINHLRSVTGQREDPLLGKFTQQSEVLLRGKDLLRRRKAHLKRVPQQLENPVCEVATSKGAMLKRVIYLKGVTLQIDDPLL